MAGATIETAEEFAEIALSGGTIVRTIWRQDFRYTLPTEMRERFRMAMRDGYVIGTAGWPDPLRALFRGWTGLANRPYVALTVGTKTCGVEMDLIAWDRRLNRDAYDQLMQWSDAQP
jgi:hypothetical protein